jgi:bacterioferritin
MPRAVDDVVVAALNEVLTGELTAINQYFLHGRMCRNFGYTRLANKIHAESIDEMKHADALIERILFLGGLPNVQRLGKVNIGETVPEMLECDLALELEALPRLQKAIALCAERGDHGSRMLFDRILASEEEHTDWLETQLGLIQQLGATAYLAEQING